MTIPSRRLQNCRKAVVSQATSSSRTRTVNPRKAAEGRKGVVLLALSVRNPEIRKRGLCYEAKASAKRSENSI